MATSTPSSSSLATATTTAAAAATVLSSSSSSTATATATVSSPLPPPLALATVASTVTTTKAATVVSLSFPSSSSSSSSSSASAAVSPSSSSNKEKTNHTRLCRLLVDIGRQVLQDVFDKIHPPTTLNAVLWSTSNQKILKNLKTKKILYGKQWDTLFPTSGAVTSADFDITLLFLLLRNICKLKAPGTGWDKPPLVADPSNEADLVRIKRCRNELYAHIVNAAIPDNEFQTLWDDVEAALLRLGGLKYQIQINRFKHGTLDADCEDNFKVLLQSWEEGEEKAVDAIHELHDGMCKMHETLLKRQDKNEDAIKRELDKIVYLASMATNKPPPASSPPPVPPGPLPLVPSVGLPPAPPVPPPPAPPAMIYIYGTVRAMIAGGMPVAWAAGSAYLLHRHRDDPEKVIKLVTGAIIPSLAAIGAVVHKLLPGSFKILVEIRSLDALDEIWKSYIEGDMKKKLEKVIVTDDLRSLAPDDAVKIDISLEISKDEYKKTRDNLLECALRNYVEAPCTYSSATLEETLTISTQVMNVGLYLKDTAKQTEPIVFKHGMIEWKVIKKLLTKARGVSVIDGEITLDISDPIDAIVHALVETSANLNVQDTQGKTPLMFAIEVGRYVLVEMLVKADADVNIPDESDTTPLMYAARSGNYVVAKLLIGAHADVNALKNWDKTPLMFAAKLGNSEVVKLLLESGARANFVDKNEETTLLYAAESGNSEVVKLILKYVARVNDVGKSNKTPLMYAAKSGNKEMAKVLKEAGANVNAVDKDMKTPLMYAAISENKEVAQVLIEAGANVNVVDKYSETPLMYAAKSGNDEVVQVLIEAGAKFDDVDEDMKTPLLYAAKSGNNEVAKVLTEAGANVNAVEKQLKKTPLMYAAESGNNELAKVLIEAGAEVNAANTFHGKTPLMYALESNDLHMSMERLKSLFWYRDRGKQHELVELVKDLVKAGADVNVRDVKGKTALMYAVDIWIYIKHYLNKHERHMSETLLMYTDEALKYTKEVAKTLIEVLIEAGAGVNVEDAQGMTALMHAIDSEEVFLRKLEKLKLDKIGPKVDDEDLRLKKSLIYAAAAIKSEIVEVLKKA